MCRDSEELCPTGVYGWAASRVLLVCSWGPRVLSAKLTARDDASHFPDRVTSSNHPCGSHLDLLWVFLKRLFFLCMSSHFVYSFMQSDSICSCSRQNKGKRFSCQRRFRKVLHVGGSSHRDTWQRDSCQRWVRTVLHVGRSKSNWLSRMKDLWAREVSLNLFLFS